MSTAQQSTELVESDRSKAEDVGSAPLSSHASADEAVLDSDGVRRFKVRAPRGCTDVLFLLLFAVFWVGMFVVAAVAASKGNPDKLIYGTDWNGEVCNTGNQTGKPFIYYPDMAEELFSTGVLESAKDAQLRGVCLEKCPLRFAKVPLSDPATYEQTDIVLPWSGEKRMIRFNTKNVFFRCIDDFHYYEIDVAQCLYFKNTANDQLVTGRYTGGLDQSNRVDKPCELYRDQYQRNAKCSTSGDFLVTPCADKGGEFGYAVKEAEQTAKCRAAVGALYPNCTEIAMGSASLTNQPATDNPLYMSLMKWSAKVARWMGDLQKAAPAIVLCGVLLAMIMGFLFTFIIQYCARIVTWATVTLALLMGLGLSLFCLAKGGVIDTDRLAEVRSNSALLPDETPLSPHSKVDEDHALVYKTMGYVFLAGFLIMVMVVLYLRRRIELAIAMIQEAAKAIRDMPLMPFFPVIPTLMLFLLLMYWMWVAANLASIDESDLADTAANTTLASFDNAPQTFKYVLLYHFFGLLWTNQVIEGVQLLTVAGAVSRWYWKNKNVDISPGQCCTETFQSPTVNAFKRALRYHLGSVAFGGLIIAIVQMLRAAFEYFASTMRDLQENSRVVKLIVCCIRCMLWCIERCFKFITFNSYIVIAMQGCNFCDGAKRAYELLSANVRKTVTVQAMCSFVMTLGRLMIVATCTLCMFGMIENGVSTKGIFLTGDLGDITSPIFPLIAVVVVSATVADEFMDVFYMAVETILLSYCEDKELNRESGMYAMPPSLRQFMGAGGAAKKYAFKSVTHKSDGLGGWEATGGDSDDDEVVDKAAL